MQEPVYYDPTGRAYAVREGVSVWLQDQPQSDVAALEYVGLWRRASARLIDTVIIYLLAFVVSVLATFVGAFFIRLTGGGSARGMLDNIARLTPAGLALSFVATTAFEVIAESVHGSTPGKMVLGITVRSVDGAGCSFAQALKRSLAFFVDGLFLGIPAATSMRRSFRRQRIGDKWAGTVVVRNRSLVPIQRRSGARFALAFLAACTCYSVIAAISLIA